MSSLQRDDYASHLNGSAITNGSTNGTTATNGVHSNNGPVNGGSDVGIVHMEVYFPSNFVDQSELEDYDGASKGKYTLGLGQTRMGFCTDVEDVNSLCLTAVSKLVEKAGISYADIGRLEVGTETLLDKSKSVKTVLMKLFEDSGNTDVEGVHSTNACYGGTAALFNCISWFVESREYDGRYAIAVCADIAVYDEGNARPTGGAGAVAMLIGPNAALVLDRGLRATHVEDVYDFYKPNMSSEYPVVDGPLSIKCYLRALDRCYQLYCQKVQRLGGKAGSHPPSGPSLSSFDAVLFHTPFCKLVQKSLARLRLNDFVRTPKESRLADFPDMGNFLNVELEKSYFDKDVEKAFMADSKAIFEAKTKPSLLLATNVGNMYTPSLYGGLVSYLISLTAEELAGKHVGLFSYGSGLVASFFSLRVSSDTSPSSPLARLRTALDDVHARLEARKKWSPDDFSQCMRLRKENHHKAPYAPVSDPATLFPGTFYLKEVDDRHRRSYGVTDVQKNGHS